MIDESRQHDAGMPESMPKILFFNVNGSGMGHMNRCLSYARRLRGRAMCSFFSLASAIEVIQEMGFEADYFVSPFWSANSTFAWNSELAIRFGMMLERVQPDVVVFDGTWPFQGFIAACEAYQQSGRSLKKVWSNRGLLKASVTQAPPPDGLFDLVIVPGEVGSTYHEKAMRSSGKQIFVPPVTLLDDTELLGSKEAREVLGLSQTGRFALFSLGPGNLKDVSGVGHALICAFEQQGYKVVWACPPISVKDLPLPTSVMPLTMYPLVRTMKAFDVFVGAAGYNTCCEVVQAGIPTLLVPNTELADDQAKRAHMLAQYAPVVVDACLSSDALADALKRLVRLRSLAVQAESLQMHGAELAADSILKLSRRPH